MKYSNEEALAMYRQMVMGRTYCLTIEKLCYEGKIMGMHHLGIGQEAISTAIRFSITKDDWWNPQQRDHAGMLYGVDLKKYTAEQFGKVTGYAQGMACDLHMSIKDTHMLFNNGLMGINYGISVGFAHGLKRAGKGQIIVADLGDGSFNEGIVYESFELATRFSEPIVFVLEDNGWAVSYSSKQYKKNLSERAAGFGLPTVIVDGNDLLAVKEAMENAVAMARKGQPSLVECKTVRILGHFVGDQQKYRDYSEVEEAKKNNDPIKRYEKVLFAEGILNEAIKAEIYADVKKQIDEAVEFAMASDFPSREVVLDKRKVYANPWEGDDK
jgi:TPP-dependent pyruvate/acetoin dehydrogenase alpha subunit